MTHLTLVLPLIFATQAYAGPMSNRLGSPECARRLEISQPELAIKAWAIDKANVLFGFESILDNMITVSNVSRVTTVEDMGRIFEIDDLLLLVALTPPGKISREPVRSMPWQIVFRREKRPGFPPGLSLAVLGDRLWFDPSSGRPTAGEFVVVAYAHGDADEATVDRVESLIKLIKVDPKRNRPRVVRSTLVPALYVVVDGDGDPTERYEAHLRLLRDLIHEVRHVPRGTWFQPLR